jgi:phage host-nuclease inhibitor protein Gam
MSGTTAAPPGLPKLVRAPVIDDLADLETALFGLCWLKHRAAEIKGLHEQEIALVAKRFEEKKTATVGKSKSEVPLAELDAAYTEAITEYCEGHRQELLEGTAKSRALGYGTINWRWQPLTVGYEQGQDATTVTNGLVEKHSLLSSIANLLKRLGLTRVLKLKPTIDLTAIRTDIRNGSKTKRELPKGLRIVDAHETLFIKPAEYARSQT